jgi:hypothetical protein
MVTNIHLYIVVITSLIYQTLSQGLCNLNIGLNKMAAFAGKGIFHNGEIDEQWKPNSVIPHITPLNIDIDYLYSMELHHAEISQAHQSIVCLFII